MLSFTWSLILISIVALQKIAFPPFAMRIVEYGSSHDIHSDRVLRGLDPRNTPGELTVTDDGAIWFRETFTWHPRIARIGIDGDFKEFNDPYTVTISNNRCLAIGFCQNANPYDDRIPLTAIGNQIKVGPILENPERVTTISANGRVGETSAAGCLAAGPNIACFARSRHHIMFAEGFTSFRSGPQIVVTPNSAVLGPDGNIWFTDSRHSQIGRVAPDGTYKLFTRGLSRWNSGPQFIAVGPDGNLWFTEKRDRVGRVTLDGEITEFSAGIPPNSSIGGIARGTDKALWFTLLHGSALGRLTTAGVFRIFRNVVHPFSGHADDPVAMIARDRRGRLYFNESQSGRIAQVTIR